MHLALSVVGLGMFVLCCVVVIWPQLAQKAHRHGVGELIYTRFFPTRWPLGAGIPPPNFFSLFFSVSAIGERLIACTPDGVEDLGQPEAYPGSLTNLWAPAENRTAWIVSAFRDETPKGLWAATSLTHGITTHVVSIPTAKGVDAGPNPPTPPVSVRAAYWDAMAAEGNLQFPKAVPTLIAYGKWTGSTITWSGYAINIATLGGLGMWLWFTPVLIRDVIRAWRRKPHMCVSCGYDIRGLTTPTCPECGAEIPRAETPPTVSSVPALETHP